jgi:putative DNA primase/helicase
MTSSRVDGSSTVRERQRNIYLASFASAARRRGLDGQALLIAVLEENARRCVPPVDRQEVARIASGANCSTARTRSVDEIFKHTGAAALTKHSSLADCETVLRKLALVAPELDTVQRALVRDSVARHRILSARAVDAALRVAPSLEPDPCLEGHAVALSDVAPWPDAVEGHSLLEELAGVFRSHVVLPPHAAEALALWVLHTHAISVAEITPRLAILSPEKRCGKTTLLKLLGALVRRPLPTTNVTAGALFRTIDKFGPTLLVDEADTFLSEREELRGILNSGHDRQGARVLRCVGENLELRSFTTWAAIAIAGIGSLHDTLSDRSVVIRMKRRTPREQVAPLRRRHLAALAPLPRKCARWARDFSQALGAMQVAPPEGLGDRAADNWEPLLAIAAIADGRWPDLARAAALGLSGPSSSDDGDSRGQLLLTDLRSLLCTTGDRITTKELLTALNQLEERPWCDYSGGNGLSAHQLARMLARFDVRSRTIRSGATTAKGFHREDFYDAFARYLPAETVTSVTTAESSSGPRESDPSQAGLVTDGPGPFRAKD